VPLSAVSLLTHTDKARDMGITDPDPAMATTVMARPPITGADHTITADTDIAPAFPVSE
jgi:hypothetical protein